MRHGYISDLDQAAESLKAAIQKAERESQLSINQARFSIGGIGLESQNVRTSLQDIPANEIQERHVDSVIQKAEDLFSEKYPNKKILHIIPIKYRVNERDVLGTPIGMYGNSIEVKVIFITILEHHYDAFINCINMSQVRILDIIAAPLADARASLSYKQKTQGSMLCNIGAETSTFSTFENGLITSLQTVAIGSNDITNDIALGLQTALNTAEEIKLGKDSKHSGKEIKNIIQARLDDILELASRQLHKIKKAQLLPAGIIFSGGGSQIDEINEHTKKELRLPSEDVHILKTSKKTKRNTRISSEFSVAYGLCMSDSERRLNKKSFSGTKILQTLKYWVSEIMP